MTTLNAKANAAYHELIAEVERENPGDVWAGFEHERDAFEAGYEAARPVVDREALIKTIDDAGCLKVGGTLWSLDRKNVREIADAVLALINGSEH